MRIEIPVYTRLGPKVQITKNGAYIKNSDGVISWAYSGKAVTGKGIYIAACARSGTMYMSKVLKAIGYSVGHEIAETDGSVGYHLAVIKPKNCFHQVRNPLEQIASMYDYQSWGFINQVIDIHGRGLLGCMQYWLLWNELLEEFCTWRYRLEDLDWSEFLKKIDHKYEPIPDIPKNVNQREISKTWADKERTVYKWADLFNRNESLAQKIKDKSIEYGYSFPASTIVAGQNESVESQVALAV